MGKHLESDVNTTVKLLIATAVFLTVKNLIKKKRRPKR